MVDGLERLAVVLLELDPVGSERRNILVDVARPEANLRVIGLVTGGSAVDEHGGAISAVEEEVVLDGLGRECQPDLRFVEVLRAREISRDENRRDAVLASMACPFRVPDFSSSRIVIFLRKEI